MTTSAGQTDLDRTRRRAHSHCVVCGRSNGRGLGVEFTARDGGVEARFQCGRSLEGYPGLVHGGVICSLLDGAMTNCIFARGLCGVTAELNVRFRHPLATGAAATVRAWVERCAGPLHVLRAELRQGGQLKATASGKFMQRAEGTS